jgi:hypothetical protein
MMPTDFLVTYNFTEHACHESEKFWTDIDMKASDFLSSQFNILVELAYSLEHCLLIT